MRARSQGNVPVAIVYSVIWVHSNGIAVQPDRLVIPAGSHSIVPCRLLAHELKNNVSHVGIYARTLI